MTGRPLPRPALRKAPDGSIHPAAPRTSALAVDPAAVKAAAKAARKGGGGGGGGKDDKGSGKGGGGKGDKSAEAPVTLQVTVPRSVRKALRRKADGHGWTAEEAAAHVLRAWVDG